MTDKENDILAREIGKIGGFGSREIAKRLPDNTYEVRTEITAPPKLVLETAFDILSQLGNVIDNIESTSELPTICAVVGSGFFNLNPTMVTIEIGVTSDTLTQVSIHGTAKEGLIKQRAGEKAAKKIAAALNESFSNKLYLKIKKTDEWDFGPGIEYSLVEINLQGFIHRMIDLDIDQNVVSFSPSSLDVYGATDHPPFSMESGENQWDEFAVRAEEFENHWQEALKMEKRAI